MKLIFEDNNISSSIKDTVKDIIKNCKGGALHKGILVEELSEEDLDLYDDPEGFIQKHKDTDDIYMVYQSVAGAWNQPLTMVAVVEY